MDTKEDQIKMLLSQLSRLEAAIFYLEHVATTLDSNLDKTDVETSINLLTKIKNDKQSLLKNLTSRN